MLPGQRPEKGREVPQHIQLKAARQAERTQRLLNARERTLGVRCPIDTVQLYIIRVCIKFGTQPTSNVLNESCQGNVSLKMCKGDGCYD